METTKGFKDIMLPGIVEPGNDFQNPMGFGLMLGHDLTPQHAPGWVLWWHGFCLEH